VEIRQFIQLLTFFLLFEFLAPLSSQTFGQDQALIGGTLAEDLLTAYEKKEIKWEPEEIVNFLRARAKERGVFLRFQVVPDGRAPISDSKQPQSNLSSFSQPRLLISTAGQNGPEFYGVTLGGEAPEIEAITRNPQDNQFDFSVIGKKNNKISGHGEGTACVVCHQDRLPIFPSAPWSEMTSPPVISKILEEQYLNKPDFWEKFNSAIQEEGSSLKRDLLFILNVDGNANPEQALQEILNSKDKEALLKILVGTTRNNGGTFRLSQSDFFQYLGVPFKSLFGVNSNGFDMTIRDAGLLDQKNKVCEFLCPPNSPVNSECKKSLLNIALLKPDIEGAPGSSVDPLRALQIWSGVSDATAEEKKITVPLPIAGGQTRTRDRRIQTISNPKIKSNVATTSEFFEQWSSRWPKEGFQYTSTIIANEDPFEGSPPSLLNDTFNGREKLSPPSSPPLASTIADPKNQRPQVNAISKDQIHRFIFDSASTCLGFSQNDLDFISRFTQEALFTFLTSRSLQNFLSKPYTQNEFRNFISQSLALIENNPSKYTEIDQSIQPGCFVDFNSPLGNIPLTRGELEHIADVERRTLKPDEAVLTIDSKIKSKWKNEIKPNLHKLRCLKCHSSSLENFTLDRVINRFLLSDRSPHPPGENYFLDGQENDETQKIQSVFVNEILNPIKSNPELLEQLKEQLQTAPTPTAQSSSPVQSRSTGGPPPRAGGPPRPGFRPGN